MSRMPSRASIVLLASAALAVLAASIGGVYAAFTGLAGNAGNVVQTASDFRAPEITAVAIGASDGSSIDRVRQGADYYVYAAVADDTGNPPSGVASVAADASELTTGATAVALTAGAYTAGGVAYDYRSEPLTADDPLAEGPASFSVTSSDVAANAATEIGSVTVDNTEPEPGA